MPTANAPTIAISEGSPSMFLSMSESTPAGAYAAPMADMAGVENDFAYCSVITSSAAIWTVMPSAFFAVAFCSAVISFSSLP